MTIDEAIRWAWELLTPTSPSARLDAEVLLAHALKKDRTFLTAYFEKPLSFWEKRRYKKLVAKRKEGRPVAYLTSEKEFYGLLLEVNPDTLIPRPDTEILVEEVVAYIRGLKMGELRGNPLLLDIGTGTGCIPIAVLSELRTLTAIATDVSKKALMVAGRNLKRYGLSGRVELRHSHLLRDLSPALFSSSEVILTANLPYIPRKFRIWRFTAERTGWSFIKSWPLRWKLLNPGRFLWNFLTFRRRFWRFI